MSRRARFHCGRTKRCMAIAPSMTCCCGACCMGSRAATTRRPPRRFQGRSGSTVSRAFIEASAAKLRALQERDLSREDVVALVLDGKTFAESTMVVALGITMTGEKRFLGFVETDTENEKVLTPFLRSLVERGLDVSPYGAKKRPRLGRCWSSLPSSLRLCRLRCSSSSSRSLAG